MTQSQHIPLLAAIFISVSIHLLFFMRAPTDAPAMTPIGAPPAIALQLLPPAQKAPVLTQEVLTTRAASNHIIKKTEEEIIQETKPAEEEIVVIKKAEFRSQPKPPVYPEKARQKKQEGLVMVLVQVDSAGLTRTALVSRSSGFPLLDKAALDAVLEWEFIPAKQNNKAILAWIEVPIDFKLR